MGWWKKILMRNSRGICSFSVSKFISGVSSVWLLSQETKILKFLNNLKLVLNKYRVGEAIKFKVRGGTIR